MRPSGCQSCFLIEFHLSFFGLYRIFCSFSPIARIGRYMLRVRWWFCHFSFSYASWASSWASVQPGPVLLQQINRTNLYTYIYIYIYIKIIHIYLFALTYINIYIYIYFNLDYFFLHCDYIYIYMYIFIYLCLYLHYIYIYMLWPTQLSPLINLFYSECLTML